MRNGCFLIFFCFIQALFADEYVLNEFALHADARDLSLGGLVCAFEPMPDNKLEITYLMTFQLKDLSIRKLDFSKTAFGLDWSVGWYQSGNADWMENNLGLHVGKNLNENFYLGVKANVLWLDNAADGMSSACFAELDCHYMLSEKLTIGLTLMNPGGFRIRSGNDRIPLSSAAFLGTRISPAKKCLLFCEVATQLNHPLEGRLGLEYALNDALILRTGLSTAPMMPSWGIGGVLNQFRYSWGGNLHPILGMSNGFTLSVCW